LSSVSPTMPAGKLDDLTVDGRAVRLHEHEVTRRR
jgi:hypothetical protein